MKKNDIRIYLIIFLLIGLSSMVSCERQEIKPDISEVSETHEGSNVVSNTSPADRFVGTWVRYSDSDIKDTLRFSNDGTFVYSLGGLYSDGSLYTDEYYYESSNNFLFYYKDPSSYSFGSNYIQFYYDNTVFTFHNFTLYPGPQVTMVYNVSFKKID